uniref:Uncharacterized protein n=1 Tax=Rhizophora mucronata TaxID=61149 RepID=A0A2P2PZT7_RHIMU
MNSIALIDTSYITCATILLISCIEGFLVR